MKKLVILFSIILAAALALWFFGRPAYKLHKERRAVELAKNFLATGDYRNANLSARQALATNPRNLEAWQIMAQLAEIARAPQLLDYRRRVVELAPTLDNKLQLAAAALLVERPPCALAAQTLDEVAATATNYARYHVVAAQLALKLNKTSEAEAHFTAAGRLEPSNQLHQLNVAVLRLRSTNETVAAEARDNLVRLSSNTNLTRIALQWLVNDCLIRKDLDAAQKYSNQLLPVATLDDRLQHLTILREAGRPDFSTFLETLQNQALTNPPAIHAVANWMIAHDLAENALRWLTNSPAKLQAEQPVPLALIDCYMALKDWSELQAWLIDEKWNDMEFVRLAALSRAEEQLRNDLSADAHWRLAVHQAGDHIGPLNSLLAMAAAWGRDKAREDLLWQIFDRFPRERWAVRELERLYGTTGNTRGLNKLYAAVTARDSQDFIVKNNFAATAMLLRTGLPKAHETAKELYLAHAAEPIVASTYAWSLQLQGHTKEGLAVLDKLTPEQLKMPAVALYYGLLLNADNQAERAAQYFALVNRSGLLPEEKELLTVAQKN